MTLRLQRRRFRFALLQRHHDRPELISGSKFLALRFQGWNGLGLSAGLALARFWTGG